MNGSQRLQDGARDSSQGPISLDNTHRETRCTLFVVRATFPVKPERMEEAIALFKADRERIGWPHAIRIYSPRIGPFNVIAQELEIESVQEYERSQAEWFATPEAAAVMEKWNELTTSGGGMEIWTLEE